MNWMIQSQDFSVFPSGLLIIIINTVPDFYLNGQHIG